MTGEANEEASDNNDYAAKDWQLKLLQKAVGQPIGIRTQRELLLKTHRHDFDKSGLRIYQVAIILLILGVVSALVIDWTTHYETLRLSTLCVLGIVIVTYLKDRQVWKRKLSAVLEEESIRPERCVICDYDLYGSTAVECPECGARLAEVLIGPKNEALAEPFDSKLDQS